MAQSTMILPFSLEGISHSTTQSVMLCVALSKLIPTLVIGRPDTMILPFLFKANSRIISKVKFEISAFAFKHYPSS